MVDTPELWLDAATTSLNKPLTLLAEPSIIQLANGNIVVGWTTNNTDGTGPGLDIVGASYDVMGNRLPGEFQLDVGLSANNESGASLAALSNGNYLNLYVSNSAAGSTLYIDQYGANNTRLSGVAVDTSAINGFYGPHDIAVGTDGKAVIFYVQNEPAIPGVSARDVVYSRTYDPSTGALGDENLVVLNNYNNDIPAMDATALGDGRYALTVQIVNPSGDDEIWVMMTGSNGLYSGQLTDFVKIPTTKGDGALDSAPTISTLDGGGFVVVWSTNTANGTVVSYRQFDGVDLTVAGTTHTLSITGDNLATPQVAALPDGGFLIVVDDNTTGRLLAYHFDSTRTQLGDALTVTTGAGVRSPDVELLADGRVAVAWFDSVVGKIDTAFLDTRDGALTGDYTPTDVQVGTVRNDSFTAATGSIARGYKGNDIIFDGAGSETIYGGAGNDTIHASGVTVGDAVYGDLGIDTLILDGMVNGTVYDGTLGKLTFGADTQVAQGFEVVIGSIANENLLGRSVGDLMRGGAGADSLDGRLGNDTLFGDDGNDRIIGGGGLDSLTGGLGADTMYGGAGNDSLYGGLGNDNMHGGTESDLLVGNDGRDWLFGEAGADTLNGLAGNDLAYGGDGNDLLDGGIGNDLLRGGNQADSLLGGAGNDTLWGDAGNDTLTGGDGADRFVFTDAGGQDVVKDWQHGIDKVDLTASTLINSLADFQSNAVDNGTGGVLLTIQAGTTILFENTTLAQFDAGDFLF